MRLKCIGGPHDDRYLDVSDDLKNEGRWLTPILPEMKVTDLSAAVGKTITMGYHLYILKMISTPERKYKFLLYEKVSIDQLFTKLFS